MAEGIDLSISCYARGKFEGLINSSIAYPLTRALYGKRVHCPMSPDFGFSTAFMEKALVDARAQAGRASGPVWMCTYALLRDLQVGEIHLSLERPVLACRWNSSVLRTNSGRESFTTSA
jgi:hypothetical protein